MAFFHHFRFLTIFGLIRCFLKNCPKDRFEVSPSCSAGYNASNGTKFALWVNPSGGKLGLKGTQIKQFFQYFACFSETLGISCLQNEATLLLSNAYRRRTSPTSNFSSTDHTRGYVLKREKNDSKKEGDVRLVPNCSTGNLF